MTVPERRTDLAKRRRIDELFDRVRAAREDVVRTGLSAVHGMGGAPIAAADAAGRLHRHS